MRFIIFSDSHGAEAKMLKALNLNLSAGLDGMIFLGDGITGAKRIADETGVKLFSVAGNCDFGIDLSKKSTYEQILDFGGKIVMLMHGHRYSVKSGTETAINYARAKSADVLLYGHTHIRDCHYITADESSNSDNKALYVFNPGSITLPLDGVCSFGLMEIRGNDILLSHGII